MTYGPRFHHLTADERLRIASRTDSVPDLEQLAEDSDTAVKRAVAHNPHTPAEILMTLTREQNQSVVLAIALRDDLTHEIFSVLADDPTAYIRMNVADHFQCPLDILARLLRDDDALVVRHAIQNPNLPAHLRALGRMTSAVDQ